MDRETRRMIEEFRRNEAGPIENNLIDEWHAAILTAASCSAAARCSASPRA